MFEICDRYRHLGRGDADYECFKYPYRFIDPSVFRLSLQVKRRMRGPASCLLHSLVLSSENRSPMSRVFLTLGAVNAFLCVALGAFGAHGLKQRLSTDMLAVYQTGVQYHFYHALGLIAVGLILLHLPASRLLTWSGWLMLAGIVLFPSVFMS